MVLEYSDWSLSTVTKRSAVWYLICKPVCLWMQHPAWSVSHLLVTGNIACKSVCSLFAHPAWTVLYFPCIVTTCTDSGLGACCRSSRRSCCAGAARSHGRRRCWAASGSQQSLRSAAVAYHPPPRRACPAVQLAIGSLLQLRMSECKASLAAPVLAVSCLADVMQRMFRSATSC